MNTSGHQIATSLTNKPRVQDWCWADAKLQSSGKSFKGKGRLYNLQARRTSWKSIHYIQYPFSIQQATHNQHNCRAERIFTNNEKTLYLSHVVVNISTSIYIFKHFDICLLHHSHPTLRSILLHTCLLHHECRVWECEKSDVYLISYSQSF